MRYLSKIVLVLFSFLLISPVVLGVSITPGNTQRATYVQGMELNYEFRVGGANFIHVYVNGPYPNITQQSTLYDPDPYGGPRTVKVKLVLDQPILPGYHKIYVSAREVSENQGAVGATAEISAPIIILSLFQGKYLRWKPYGRNLNVGEIMNLTIEVTSLGTEKINSIYGEFEVFDQQGNYIDKFTTNSISLESNKVGMIIAEFDSTGLPNGQYYFNSTLYWDENISGPMSGSFRIGSLDILLEDYTKSFIKDAVNVFELKLSSDWNDDINEIYAEITTPNGKIKTPTESLDKFTTGTLQTYWDTSGLEFGDYDARVDLYFEGQSTFEIIKLSINETGLGVELPKKETIFSNMSTTTIILIILIFVLVINFVFFFVRGMRKK